MSKDDPVIPEFIRGQCLCGGFQFEISEPIGEVRLCHCDLCRRANGTAFVGSKARWDRRPGPFHRLNVALTVHPFELVVNVVCCNRL